MELPPNVVQEACRPSLALDRALHVRDFLRPFVNQKNDQIAVGVIGRD